MGIALRSVVPDTKPAFVSTRTSYLRYVAEEDAEQILEIRRSRPGAGQLSPTSEDVNVQRDWLRNYLQRCSAGQEHYFMACNINGEGVGTVRIHDVTPNACWWGSWIVLPGQPISLPLETFTMVNWLIFDHLRIPAAMFFVPNGKLEVIRFHDAMSSPRMSTSDTRVDYRVDLDWYAALKRRYARYFADIRCSV